MKDKKRFKNAFGLNENDCVDFPIKVSSVKISRIANVDMVGDCSYCFPHGIECTNSKYGNIQRTWKKYRKTQYK